SADAYVVIQDAGDNSSYFGPMSHDIAHVPIAISDVEAMNVVDVSVVIVVDAIPSDLSGIRINIVSKVRMTDVDPGISHCNNHARAACRYRPRVLSVNVCPHCRNKSVDRVSPIQQCPLRRELRVVGPDSSQLYQPVRLSVFDLAACLQAANGRFYVLSSGKLHHKSPVDAMGGKDAGFCPAALPGQ